MTRLSKFTVGSLALLSIGLAVAAWFWQNRNRELWLPYREALTCSLFLTDPEPFDEKIPADISSAETFHGYPIVAEAMVSITPTLRNAIFELERDSRPWKTNPAACFIPRHGIRVVISGVVFDLQMCYECNQARFYRDGNFLKWLPFAGAADPVELNRILQEVGVKPQSSGTP